MFGLFLTGFLPSLISIVSSTPEYPKRGEGWYPASSLEISASQVGRDRRTTHWESRSHSNLDHHHRRVDDDRDRGLGPISYPLFVEQPSPLGFPSSRVELSGKSSSEIDFSDEESVDNDSMLDRCIDTVRKPILLVLIQCWGKSQAWRRQEPLYVQEPSLIVVNLNQQTGPGDDEPFYVARGKRSLRVSDDDQRARTKKDLKPTNIDSTDSSLISQNHPTVYRRKKRDTRSDALRSSISEDQELGLRDTAGFGAYGLKSHPRGYVSPRNKHSDILDILNEPFFIARGKKNSMTIRRFEWYNRYARKQFLNGKFSPIGETKNVATDIDDRDPRSNDCFVDSFAVGSQVDPRSIDNPSAFKDHREIIEELLKTGDLFYVARGKKLPASSTAQWFNDNSDQRLWAFSNTGLLNDRPTVKTSLSQPNLSIVH